MGIAGRVCHAKAAARCHWYRYIDGLIDVNTQKYCFGNRSNPTKRNRRWLRSTGDSKGYSNHLERVHTSRCWKLDSRFPVHWGSGSKCFASWNCFQCPACYDRKQVQSKRDNDKMIKYFSMEFAIIRNCQAIIYWLFNEKREDLSANKISALRRDVLSSIFVVLCTGLCLLIAVAEESCLDFCFRRDCFWDF